MTCIPAALTDVVPRTDLPAHLRDIGEVRTEGLVFSPRHSFITKREGVPGYVFDVTKEDGTVLGVGCISFAENHSHVERGGHIGVQIHPEFQSQGYGLRFVRGLLPLLSEQGIKEALLTCAADHEAAMQVCRGAGALYLDELSPEVPGESARARFLLKL